MKKKKINENSEIDMKNILAITKYIGEQILINNKVETSYFDEIIPKGFARPTPVFKVLDFISEKHKNSRQNFSHKGSRVEVNILDTSDIKAAIEELKMVEEKFNKILQKGKDQNKEMPK